MVIHVRKIGCLDVGMNWIDFEDLINNDIEVFDYKTKESIVIDKHTLFSEYEFRTIRMKSITYEDSLCRGLAPVYSKDWPMIFN